MIARTLAILLLGASLQAAERPNVLFIAVDDLRASVGVFGDKLAVTPHIDALGARGTVFANAHCQIAICNPSRASVMTGMRPDTLRVWGLKKHFREEKPKVITLPQWFKQHGYHTHSIGKIYHGSGKPSTDPPSWSGQPEFDHCEKIDQYLLPKNRTGGKAAGAESSPSADSDHLDGKVAEAAIQKLRLLKRTRPALLPRSRFSQTAHAVFCSGQVLGAVRSREAGAADQSADAQGRSGHRRASMARGTRLYGHPGKVPLPPPRSPNCGTAITRLPHSWMRRWAAWWVN